MVQCTAVCFGIQDLKIHHVMKSIHFPSIQRDFLQFPPGPAGSFYISPRFTGELSGGRRSQGNRGIKIIQNSTNVTEAVGWPITTPTAV